MSSGRGQDGVPGEEHREARHQSPHGESQPAHGHGDAGGEDATAIGALQRVSRETR